jgi:hypothetical protein
MPSALLNQLWAQKGPGGGIKIAMINWKVEAQETNK